MKCFIILTKKIEMKKKKLNIKEWTADSSNIHFDHIFKFQIPKTTSFSYLKGAKNAKNMLNIFGGFVLKM